MDRAAIRKCFEDYVSHYDPENPMIAHKISHTYRVAELAERIAQSLHREDISTDFAWVLGLLHDIGRFEQVRRYGTFVDSQSVDHAEFGADLLFRENLIEAFPMNDMPENWREITETAIRQHNKLSLPDNLGEPLATYAQILRDADKVDIFRVVCELPLKQRAGRSRGMLSDAPVAAPEVMECVYQHRCVPRAARKSVFDVQLSHICMAFELVYPESRRCAVIQGYLARLLSPVDERGKILWADVAAEQLQIAKGEIESAWGMVLVSERKQGDDSLRHG